MRKKEVYPPKSTFSLSRPTHILLVIGLLLIALPLFYLTFEITEKQMLTVYERKVYALALEHILAGFTLLTGGCYLVERVMRAKEKE